MNIAPVCEVLACNRYYDYVSLNDEKVQFVPVTQLAGF